jgi:hypothetical protein
LTMFTCRDYFMKGNAAMLGVRVRFLIQVTDLEAGAQDG